jgi:hypothetical protein
MRASFGLELWMPALLLTACLNALDGRGASAGEREPLQALMTTSELVVGQNRFAFGLLKHNTLLADADVAVRVYDIRDDAAKLVMEAPAPYRRLEVVEDGKPVHVHPDGTRHVHGETTDMRGIYVAHVTFDRPGAWGVEVLARRNDGSAEATRFTVDVLAVSRTPALGAAAPRSRNLVAGDVSDLRQIDSSEPPDPRLHQVRIADAIAQGKPQVIVFATPKYCASRVCGPVLDVVRTLIPAYGRRVAFVHQEIWESGSLQKFSPTVEEWSLRTEPWIFVVDGQGIIRARFEGLTTRRELEAALRQMLDGR